MSAADRLPFTAPDRMRSVRLRAESRYMREYSHRLCGHTAEVRNRTISLRAQLSGAPESRKSTGGDDRVFELASSDGMTSTACADRSRGGDAGAFMEASRPDHANRLAEAVQRLLRAQSPRSGVLAVGVPVDRYACGGEPRPEPVSSAARQ